MITQTVNNVRRTIDGISVNDKELLALVQKAYRRTAKIVSRGVEGHNEHYASACGVLELAFGQNFLTELGFSQDWHRGFHQGFEFTGKRWEGPLNQVPYAKPVGAEDFNTGFQKGEWVADQVLHHWPDSPDIHSVPEK